MTVPPPRSAMAGLATAVLLSTAVALAAPPSGRGGGRGAGPRTFEVSGSVEGLVPTVVTTFPVRLESPYRFAITIVDITVVVGEPDGGCSAADLVVVPPAVPVAVPRLGETVVTGTAALAVSVPDACQAAVWPLTWSATAERA